MLKNSCFLSVFYRYFIVILRSQKWYFTFPRRMWSYLIYVVIINKIGHFVAF